MSVGYSFQYYRNTRNPLIEQMLRLGAISADSAVTIDAILEADRVTESVVSQFIELGYISKCAGNRLFLNVGRVKHDALLKGILQLAIGETIIVVILLMMVLLPTTVNVSLLVLVLIFVVGNAILGILSYLEAWPWFRFS